MCSIFDLLWFWNEYIFSTFTVYHYSTCADNLITIHKIIYNSHWERILKKAADKAWEKHEFEETLTSWSDGKVENLACEFASRCIASDRTREFSTYWLVQHRWAPSKFFIAILNVRFFRFSFFKVQYDGTDFINVFGFRRSNSLSLRSVFSCA